MGINTRLLDPRLRPNRPVGTIRGKSGQDEPGTPAPGEQSRSRDCLSTASSSRFNSGAPGPNDLAPPWDLLPFQRKWLRGTLGQGIRTSALSIPRGNGKSSLVAWLCARSIWEGDELFGRGEEVYLAAASIGQCRRTTFKLMRQILARSSRVMQYRFAETPTQCAVVHEPTNTRLSVLACRGKLSQGLVSSRLIVCDEPASWEVTGGQHMYEAVQGALGKPGSKLKTLYIGTLAPLGGGRWWWDLIEDGTHDDTFVSVLKANPEKWDEWREIRRVNPLMVRYPDSLNQLRSDFLKAKKDSRAKAFFLSYRLNIPSADESEVLLTVDDWKAIVKRELQPREGKPVVGIDTASGRAWMTAVAIWRTGRVEAVALAPGIPDLGKQEQRDRVSAGTYKALEKAGVLRIAHGCRIQPVAMLKELVDAWDPALVVGDRHRGDEIGKEFKGIPVRLRYMRSHEADADIRDLRRAAIDMGLSIEPKSAGLIDASLAVTTVKREEGALRIVKENSNRARDDVSSAFTLAGAMFARRPKAKRKKYHGLV